MQLHSRVLVGMGVGALIGLGWGPQSTLLKRDTYRILDASDVELRRDREAPATVLTCPEGASLELAIKRTVSEKVVAPNGRAIRMPVWAEVRFVYTRSLALRDTKGRLKQQLGNPSVGQSVGAWLKIQHLPLAGGGLVASPKPVSGTGLAVMRWLRPVGQAFMSLIKMIVVPLVFASLLVGVAGLGDVRRLGRLGGKTLAAYLVTTALAVGIGLLCAHAFQPGAFIDEAERAGFQAEYDEAVAQRAERAATAPSAVDNLVSIIPDNPIESLASGNMLQIIFFAVVLGVALTVLGRDKSAPVVRFFDTLQEAMIVVVRGVMAVAPVGVAALVADVVGHSGLSLLGALLMYALAVLTGFLIHVLVVYGGIVRLLTPMRLRTFLRGTRDAQLIAFSTSSSSAALPVSMTCAEKKLGISNSVASFVLPLGVTVNMDGTALYQGVAAVFIAQVFQIDLTVGDQLAIIATATVASIGTGGVPGAGTIMLAMVLTSVGIPTVGVALVMGMDRILDMFRSAVNVVGDLAITAMVAASEGELREPEP